MMKKLLLIFMPVSMVLGSLAACIPGEEVAQHDAVVRFQHNVIRDYGPGPDMQALCGDLTNETKFSAYGSEIKAQVFLAMVQKGNFNAFRYDENVTRSAQKKGTNIIVVHWKESSSARNWQVELDIQTGKLVSVCIG